MSRRTVKPQPKPIFKDVKIDAVDIKKSTVTSILGTTTGKPQLSRGRENRFFDYTYQVQKYSETYRKSIWFPIIDSVIAAIIVGSYEVTEIEEGADEGKRQNILDFMFNSEDELSRSIKGALQYTESFLSLLETDGDLLHRMECFQVGEMAVGGTIENKRAIRDGRFVLDYATRNKLSNYVDISPKDTAFEEAKDGERYIYHVKTSSDVNNKINGVPPEAFVTLSCMASEIFPYLSDEFSGNFVKPVVLLFKGGRWMVLEENKDDDGNPTYSPMLETLKAINEGYANPNTAVTPVVLPHAADEQIPGARSFQADDLKLIETTNKPEIGEVISSANYVIKLIAAAKSIPLAYLGMTSEAANRGGTTELKDLVGILNTTVIRPLQRKYEYAINRFISLNDEKEKYRVKFPNLKTNDVLEILELFKGDLLTSKEGRTRLPDPYTKLADTDNDDLFYSEIAGEKEDETDITKGAIEMAKAFAFNSNTTENLWRGK